MILYNSFLAYSYLCTKKIAQHDFEKIKKTKTYVKFRNLLKANGLENVLIHIELLNSKKDFRSDLDAFIRELQFKTYQNLNETKTAKQSVSGVLIIDDLFSLGGNEQQIVELYSILYNLKIGLFILQENKPCSNDSISYTKYKTINQEYLSDKSKLENLSLISQDSFEANVSSLHKMSLRSSLPRSGRTSKHDELPHEFPLVYWLYESYMIHESEALQNEFFKLSKNVFYKYCQMYEQSDFYGLHETAFEAFDYRLKEKPKRYGTIREDFSNWLLLHDEKCINDLSANEYHNFSIPPNATDLTINRYRLKAKNGKSGMSIATRRYYYPDAIEQFKHIQNEIFDM